MNKHGYEYSDLKLLRIAIYKAHCLKKRQEGNITIVQENP